MAEGARIVLSADAARTIRDACWAALPRETGGILVGWRGGASRLSVTAMTAVVVVDPVAGRTAYELDRERAQRALDVSIAHGLDSRLGYVGEWHSHPAPQPPSSQDLHSLSDSARLASGPVALVVAALSPPVCGLTWYGRVGERRSRFRRVRVYATEPEEMKL